MHKLIADRGVCSGYGNCVAAAPEVFDIGDDDLVMVLHGQIPEDQLTSVRDAVGSCPTSALTLENADN